MLVEEVVRDNLLAIAAAYCQATGRSLVAVSKDFYGNRDFFAKLSSGTRLASSSRPGAYSVSLRKLDMILARFRAEWPKGVPWPRTRAISMGRRRQLKK
jgi:hypothetical protein